MDSEVPQAGSYRPTRRRLYELLNQWAAMNGWQIVELHVQPDHVHLLVQPPKEAVSHAMHLMKGGTSKIIRSEFPELEKFLWVDGYFAESVGQVTGEHVKQYIQNQ